jgi:hypothetical protein
MNAFNERISPASATISAIWTLFSPMVPLCGAQSHEKLLETERNALSQFHC